MLTARAEREKKRKKKKQLIIITAKQSSHSNILLTVILTWVGEMSGSGGWGLGGDRQDKMAAEKTNISLSFAVSLPQSL